MPHEPETLSPETPRQRQWGRQFASHTSRHTGQTTAGTAVTGEDQSTQQADASHTEPEADRAALEARCAELEQRVEAMMALILEYMQDHSQELARLKTALGVRADGTIAPRGNRDPDADLAS